MKKDWPRLTTDDEAERFVAEADLTVTVALSVKVKNGETEGMAGEQYDFETTARGSVVNDPIKVRFE